VINREKIIISRASLDSSAVKLRRAGATNVNMPDKIGGQRRAKLVAQPDVLEFIELILLQNIDSVVLEEISCQNLSSCLAGKSISELDIRNTSRANIVGMKRSDKSYMINPVPETTLASSDKLFALGTKSQINQLIKTITSEGGIV
jgi:voltage-gated potassium channel